MKEFTSTLKQAFKAGKGDIWLYVGLTLFGGIGGSMVTLLSLYIDGTGDAYGQLGAMVALIAGGIMLFVAGLVYVPNDFNLAVSMGRVRRYFVMTRYFCWMTRVAVVLVLTLITGLLENFICSLIYPEIICAMDVVGFLRTPVVLLVLLLVIPAVIMLLGGLMLRFANKFIWVFWGATMVFNVLCQRISREVRNNPDSVFSKIGYAIEELYMNTPAVAGLVVVFVVAAICLLVSMTLLRKQRVNL